MGHEHRHADTEPLPDIPGYHLLRALHRGALSVVYLAEQASPPREVAIKVISPHALSDEVSRRRFENEARTIARLEHPNVVRIHEVGRTNQGLPYYAMPYLGAGHLGQRSFRLPGGGVDEARVVAIVRALLSALGYAHARGVVHRDVKAENVLFDDTGQPLLADFGIALRRGFGPRVTAAGLAVGTTAYMAPEQARGEDVDGRADLYSLAVLAWEMLAGALPYRADDALSMAVMHAQNPIPKLPPALRHWQRFMNRAMAKQPQARFQDVAQMGQALDSVTRRQRWPAPLAYLPALPPAGRRRALALAGIGIVAVGLGGAGLLLANRDAGDEFLRAGMQAALDGRHDPIAAMLQPLPEAPVQLALDEARRQLGQRQLTAPAGDNAYASVLRAWQAEPDNAEVQRVVAELGTALGQVVLTRLDERADSRAREYFGHVRQLGEDTGSAGTPALLQVQEAIGAKLRTRVEQAAARGDQAQALASARLAVDFGLPEPVRAGLLARAEAVASRPHPADTGHGATRAAAGFTLAARPVSRDEYARFAEATGREPARCRERGSLLRVLAPRDWREPGFGQGGNEPVVCVSMADAQAFATWHSAQTGHAWRLPTAEETRQSAPEISGRDLSLWVLDCGADCGQRVVDGTSWRQRSAAQRTLAAGRGYDDVGFRLLRER